MVETYGMEKGERIFGLDEEVNELREHYKKRIEDEKKVGYKFDQYLKDFGRTQRSDEDYLIGLIYNFFIEDCFKMWFKKKFNKTLESSGCDAERKIKINSRITQDPDFIIKENGKKLELKFARKMFEELNIKEGCAKRCINEHSFIIMVVEFNKYTLFGDTSFQRSATPNPRWGNKLCYSFASNELKFKSMEAL